MWLQKYYTSSWVPWLSLQFSGYDSVLIECPHLPFVIVLRPFRRTVPIPPLPNTGPLAITELKTDGHLKSHKRLCPWCCLSQWPQLPSLSSNLGYQSGCDRSSPVLYVTLLQIQRKEGHTPENSPEEEESQRQR